MVQLGHQGRPSSGQALDHHHLPQGAIGVERSAHHVGHQVLQLRLAAGCGEGRPAEMVVELELGVVGPHRVVQPEGDPERPLAHGRRQVDPLLDHPADLRVAG